MSYQVLARKWRPQNFEQMVGQSHVVKALVNALDSGRLHHGYLFTGTRGVGKTTVARVFAKALNCEQGISSTPCGQCGMCEEIAEGRHVDLIEVDAASRTKVEDTRELLENVHYSPTRGRFKIYLIDEVHMLSAHSFNALLKTLEEPPPHVKFLLATTDPQKLPVTVLSRCLQFNLKALSTTQLEKHLSHVLANEQIEYEPQALTFLAAAAQGSVRDALSLSDQAIAHCGGVLKEADVAAMLNLVQSSQVVGLIRALLAEDAPMLMDEMQQLHTMGVDYGAVLARLESEFHQIALAKQFPEAYEKGQSGEVDYVALASPMSAEQIQLYYQMALVGKRDLPWAPDPRCGFEMTLIRMLSFTLAEAEGHQPASENNERIHESHSVSGSGSRSKAASMRERAADYEVTSPVSPPAAPAAVEPGSKIIADGEVEEWKQLLPQLRLSGLAEQLALHSSLEKSATDHWIVRVDPNQVSLLGSQSESRLRERLQAEAGEGVRISIEASANPIDTPFKWQQRQDAIKLERAKQDLKEDPVMKDIVDTFGVDLDNAIVQPRD